MLHIIQYMTYTQTHTDAHRHTQTERERERERKTHTHTHTHTMTSPLFCCASDISMWLKNTLQLRGRASFEPGGKQTPARNLISSLLKSQVDSLPASCWTCRVRSSGSRWTGGSAKNTCGPRAGFQHEPGASKRSSCMSFLWLSSS